MPSYLITWNSGFGQEHDVVECSDQYSAKHEAYLNWRDNLQDDYSADLLTIELCDWYGLDPEEYGLEEVSDG